MLLSFIQTSGIESSDHRNKSEFLWTRKDSTSFLSSESHHRKSCHRAGEEVTDVTTRWGWKCQVIHRFPAEIIWGLCGSVGFQWINRGNKKGNLKKRRALLATVYFRSYYLIPSHIKPQAPVFLLLLSLYRAPGRNTWMTGDLPWSTVSSSSTHVCWAPCSCAGHDGGRVCQRTFVTANRKQRDQGQA